MIKIRNITKKYQLESLSIKDKIAGSIGGKRGGNIIFALEDVSFELKKGEILGIIGSNGSGKSTILKLIAGITVPDEGEIEVNGSVSSLIELGAGFHPELTARDNVFLCGSIMGMKKKEIESKFDKIVDFAELWDFIDMPVKHYSSGMYARLGFSTAIHTDPDILLVDEVLSVGDQGFQIKCFRRMNELLSSGVTVILVSHSMTAIERICKRTICLSKGKINMDGATLDVIKKYMADDKQITEGHISESANNPVNFLEGKIHRTEKKLIISLKFKTDIPVKNPNIVIILWKGYSRICNMTSGKRIASLESGHYSVNFEIDSFILSYGHYHISARLRDYSNPLKTYGINGRLAELFVEDNPEQENGINLDENGDVAVESEMSLENCE